MEEDESTLKIPRKQTAKRPREASENTPPPKRTALDETETEASGRRPPPKNGVVHISSDSEEDTTLVDKSVLNNNPDIAPDEMSEILDDLFKFIEDHDWKKRPANTYRSVIKTFVEKRNYPIPIDVITHAYRVYSREAVKKMDFEVERMLLNKYLDSASVVAMYPEFPKKAPSVLEQYRRMNNLPFDMSKTAEYKKQMEADEEGRKEAEEAVHKMQAEDLEKFGEFIEVHADDINDEQKKFIENKMKALRSKLFPEETPKASRQKKKATPPPEVKVVPPRPKAKTIFEYYQRSFEEDEAYAQMDEEKKEKKIRRKFDKLSEPEKRMLDTCFHLYSTT